MSRDPPGMYYEEFEVGSIIEHRPGRTVTEFDNTMFSLLTMNNQPLHIDAEFSANTEFGERIVNSLFTLAVVGGMSVNDTTAGTTIANLGFEAIDFPNPVFVGDTLYASTKILDKRLSESRDDSAIVKFQHYGETQDGTTVCEMTRHGLMELREHAEG